MKRILRQIPGLATTYHQARLFCSMAYWSWWADAPTANDRSLLRKQWDFSSAETSGRYSRSIKLATTFRPQAVWGDVLELGCAEGVFTQGLARRSASVTACDISKVALSRTSERCASFGNVKVEACDVEDLRLARTFDIIFAMGVLEFIRGRKRLAATATAIQQVLKPNGLLVLTACRLPAEIRDRKWAAWMGCDGDQIAHFFSQQPAFRVLHREIYPPPQEPCLGSVEQVIAIVEKIG